MRHAGEHYGTREAAGTPPPRSVGLFLVPNFSMLAFSSTVEPLRAANFAAERELYEWTVYSADGGLTMASNGVGVAASGSFGDAKEIDLAIVCSGILVEQQDHRDLIDVLRRLSAFGVSIGAVCTGTYVLAKGGLLDGFSATVHWENQPSLLSEFAGIDIVEELFRIDGKRYTCAGGTAAIDMMLAVIREHHDEQLVTKVIDQLIHHRTRDASERQRMELRTRLATAHPKLCTIIELMEEQTESPLSCAKLASAGGLSVRQLERLFATHVGQTPSRHYLEIRLKRARRMLRQTSHSVLQIALACGFTSASHFSKAYHETFGCTPSAERRAKLNQLAKVALKVQPYHLSQDHALDRHLEE
ncbi:MAG: GlxA family transcriptional regulator [Devosia sp.]